MASGLGELDHTYSMERDHCQTIRRTKQTGPRKMILTEAVTIVNATRSAWLRRQSEGYMLLAFRRSAGATRLDGVFHLTGAGRAVLHAAA